MKSPVKDVHNPLVLLCFSIGLCSAELSLGSNLTLCAALLCLDQQLSGLTSPGAAAGGLLAALGLKPW